MTLLRTEHLYQQNKQKKPGRSLKDKTIALMLLFLLLFPGPVLAGPGEASSETELLNDRTADIIASNILLAPGLLTPSGLSGKGQIIGIADSGLDKGSISDLHPDLQSEAGKMPRVAMLKSYAGRSLPDDPIGHGTHMAATIAGSGNASAGKYRGIAPGASLYFQALLDQAGQLKLPEQIGELFRPAYEAGVRIHVNGWGGGSNAYSSRSAQIDQLVYSFPDFLPVFGAGNNGPGKASLTTEANSKNALTIGCSQLPRPAFGPEARYAEQIAASSSRGPAADGRIKPELLAPGSAVVSACSRLLESNYAPNPNYTLMGGSSMAAAVAGGALALLSEYLELDRQMSRPSSALMKALLINGARTPGGFPSNEEGFGILDLAGTVLALQEGSFQIIDNDNGIDNGESVRYQARLTEGGRDFKVTLAWVDPPAAPASKQTLLNNLDLIIEDPQGRIFYGNDFRGQGQADTANNVEQIHIKDAVPGEYKITVRGTRLDRPQKFALVYGQALKHDIISSRQGQILKLSQGEQKDTSGLQLFKLSNGRMQEQTAEIPEGSDYYSIGQKIYIVSRSWLARGVQVLSEGLGYTEKLLLEMDKQLREGGFFIDPSLTGEGRILLNKIPVNDSTIIPPGSEVNALINPSQQTIWQLKAAYEEVGGFIETLDPEQRELKLLHDERNYRIAEHVVISYLDRFLDCDPVDAPYGTEQVARLENLAPGLKVSLTLSPSKQEIQYIKVERELVLGQAAEVDAKEGEIKLESGQSYRLFPGNTIIKDQQPGKLEEVKTGDHIAALLLNGTSNILHLLVSSEVYYGRVLFYSEREKMLYIQESKANSSSFRKVPLDTQTEIFHSGLQAGVLSLLPGSWVRVINCPDQDKAWRVDAVYSAREDSSYFSAYDPVRQTVNLQDGSILSISRYTQIIKGSYNISPQMLIPGEKVNIVTLAIAGSSNEFLARLEVEVAPGTASPQLEAKAYVLNGILILQGWSSSPLVYIYRSDVGCIPLEVGADGSFSQLFKMKEDEHEVTLLTIEHSGGAIKGLSLPLLSFAPEEAGKEFSDLAGHPWEHEIKKLLEAGIISGYEDGSFKPEKPISRAEFICLLARAQGWDIGESREQNYFSDNREIPWWALGAVYAAQEQEIIKGYPDGSFRPRRNISRAEMAVIMAALQCSEKKNDQQEEQTLPELPFLDRFELPSWAMKAFQHLYHTQQLNYLDYARGSYIDAERPLSRAEAAAIIAKMWSEE